MEGIRAHIRDPLGFKGREMKLSMHINIQKVSESLKSRLFCPKRLYYGLGIDDKKNQQTLQCFLSVIGDSILQNTSPSITKLI